MINLKYENLRTDLDNLKNKFLRFLRFIKI